MYECESWTTEKAECPRTDAFELLCWRRLFRIPWTARRSALSILKEINPEYSLEALTLMLKLRYFGHLMWRDDSLKKKKTRCRKRLKVRGEGGSSRYDGLITSLTQWTWIWANLRWWWRTEEPGVLQSMELQRVRHDLMTEQQQHFLCGW